MGKTKVVALGTLVGVALTLAPLSSAFADTRFDHWGHGGHWGGGHGNVSYSVRGGGHGCRGCLWPFGLAAAAVGTVAAAVVNTAAAVVTLPFVALNAAANAPYYAPAAYGAAGRRVRRRDAAFLLQQRGACLLRAARALLQQRARSGLLRSARSAGLLPRCPRVLRATRALLRSAPAELRSARAVLRSACRVRSACAVLRSAFGSGGGAGLRLRTAAGLLQPGSAGSRLLRLSTLIASADEAIGRGRFGTASSN